VLLYSISVGEISGTTQYTYNPTPLIITVTPSTGPAAGDNEVTIFGDNLGNGTDITSVVLCGSAKVKSIKSQTTSTVTVIAAAVTTGCTGSVTIKSILHGKVSGGSYQYNVVPQIDHFTPQSGPFAGGNTVTIIGTTNIGDDDITSVLFGSQSATILSQSATQVIVTSPAAGSDMDVAISVQSVSFGDATGTGTTYHYNADPVITSVIPQEHYASGGSFVTIAGTIGGDDVTAVTLNGVAATINDTQATSITVISSPGYAHVGKGDVVVQSTTYGIATLSQAFSYLPDPQILLVSPSYGPISGGNSITVYGCNLPPSISSVSLAGITVSTFNHEFDTVIATAGSAPHEIVGDVIIISSITNVVVKNSSLSYSYCTRTISAVQPNEIPVAGGVDVTISGSCFSVGTDVTQVLLDGVSAEIIFQNATTVIVLADSGTSALETGDVSVSSESFGIVTSPAIFKYIPAATILQVMPSSVPGYGGTNVTVTYSGNASAVNEVTLNTVPASIMTASSDIVVVTNNGLSDIGTGDVWVQSSLYGIASLQDAFTYNSLPLVTVTIPDSGPLVGGYPVTIIGCTLGNGTDITAVVVDNTIAPITTQWACGVVVTIPDATSRGPGSPIIKIISTSFGHTETNYFAYNPAPVITSVVPDYGTIMGGTIATISGLNMGMAPIFIQ